MNAFVSTALKLYWGFYLLLSSLFCLLGFIPYTFMFLIKEPPYVWLVWFPHNHSILYWSAFAAFVVAYRQLMKKPLILTAALVQGGMGVWVAVSNPLPSLHNDWTAYAWSIAFLAPVLLAAAGEVLDRRSAVPDTGPRPLFAYANAILVGILTAIVSVVGALRGGHVDPAHVANIKWDLELVGYVTTIHLWIAVLIVSILNLVLLLTRKATTRDLRRPIIGILVFFVLSTACIRFLQNALTFRGWQTYLYSATLSAAVTLLFYALVRSHAEPKPGTARDNKTSRRLFLAGTVVCLVAIALVVPQSLAEADWNNVLESAFILLFWIVLSLCAYGLRPSRRSYSVPAILAILLVGGFAYWWLTASAFVWASQLGPDEDDLTTALQDYSNRSVSFDLATIAMRGGRYAECNALCKTIRQNTNIPEPEAKSDVLLAGQLVPAQGDRPNIFIIVVDSLRQDYVGAYNPRVDFTPNLDALASDSIVMRHAYTQYAGTSLSEPTIWAGTVLLHAHYLRPFDRVNSLKRLVKTDGYEMIVSYDDVLRHVLPEGDFVALDTNHQWIQEEVGSTLRQLESILDARSGDSRPVFFYSQPKNVHAMAHNNLPLVNAQWKPRPEFSPRISFEVHQVDQAIGEFVAYLKSRNLYDKSIIIFTSDHGEATGELGRSGHGIVFPEVVRVPLIIHLPKAMREKYVCDRQSLAALTDITPTLYYLLGHRPITKNDLFGRPIFVSTTEELKTYRRDELFFASDTHANYGWLTENGFMYTVSDSPFKTFLFDLQHDPQGLRNIASDSPNKFDEQRLVDYLHKIATFYGYTVTGGRDLVAAH
jgi:glucan phosphoethanolaminetransferase (alkaline phosphatase superfamily)